jgi:hypothetical protein
MSSLTCLVISAVGDAGSDARKRADQVFKHIIEPVVTALGFAAKRVDEMRLPGIITGEVLAAVVDSHLVVADLTGYDGNVFYELAIRHAAQRPVVQMIDSAQRPPFDLADTTTIYVDIHDLDSAEDARRQLKDQIEGANTAAPVDTPAAAAKSMKTLWESQEPAAPVLAEALTEIRALESERIRRQGASPGPPGGEATRAASLLSTTGQLSFPGQPLFPGRPLFSGLPAAYELDGAAAEANGTEARSADNHLADGPPADNDSVGKHNGKRGSRNHDDKPAASAKARKARKRHG